MAVTLDVRVADPLHTADPSPRAGTPARQLRFYRAERKETVEALHHEIALFDATEAVLERLETQRHSELAEQERIERRSDILRDQLDRIDAAIQAWEEASAAHRNVHKRGVESAIQHLSLRDRVLTYLADGEPQGATEIATGVSGAYHSVAKSLRLLHDGGFLSQLPDGRYRAAKKR